MKDWVRLIIGGMFILLVCISTVHMNRKMNDVSGLREQITRLETELGKKEQQLRIYDAYFEQYSKDSHQGW